jgi:hypothetical protein
MRGVLQRDPCGERDLCTPLVWGVKANERDVSIVIIGMIIFT